MFLLIWKINSMIGLKKRFFRNIYSAYFTHISNIYKIYIESIFRGKCAYNKSDRRNRWTRADKNFKD